MHLFHHSKGTLPYRDTKEQSKVDPRCSLFQQALTVCLRFCEAYGSVIAYYGAAIGALGASIVIPILNEFEGGCKYPYLSEVARNGVGWLFFFLGTLVGWIPWVIFSWNYYKVFNLYSVSIEDEGKKNRFLFFQKVVLVCNALSALGMHATAFFDMGHYPMTHEYSVVLFAVPLVLVMIVNCVDMIKYAGERDTKKILFRLMLIIGAVGGIAGFTLLGRIEHCKSVVITLEECLRLTSEQECYKYIDAYNDGWTVLRNYPRCRVMHFWRGFMEFVAVTLFAEYMCQLYYDRNTVQHLLFKKYGILPTNSYVVKELSAQDEEMVNELSPSIRSDMHV